MVRAAPWIPLALGVLLSAGCGDDDGDGTIDAALGPDASPAAPNIQIASLTPPTLPPGQKVMSPVIPCGFRGDDAGAPVPRARRLQPGGRRPLLRRDAGRQPAAAGAVLARAEPVHAQVRDLSHGRRV